ncbi:MAG: hypothetical protein FWH01_13170 [Oscillospiraceae bacterium]|nr:hypothetical protein [Oscillospiraceae bacterium]
MAVNTDHLGKRVINKGYLAKEATRREKDAAVWMAFFIIIAGITGAIIYNIVRFMPEILFNFVIVFYGAAVLVLIVAASVTAYRLFKRGIFPDPYAGLTVYADGVDKYDAGRVIDSEAAQGKILVNANIRELAGNKIKTTEKKIVLMPSYLLIGTENNSFTVIPTRSIFWVCVQMAYRDNVPIGKLKVFCDRKIHEVNNVEFLHAQHIVNELYRFMSNVFTAYNPFLLSVQLEHLFHKDYKQFVEIFVQHSKEFHKTGSPPQ